MTVTPESIAGESESSQQSALFCWAAMQSAEWSKRITNVPVDWLAASKCLSLLHAIPNGDQRGDGTKKGAQIAGNRLKREGLKSGVPDVCLPVPTMEYDLPQKFGLYIEMKKPDLKRANDPLHGCSDEQKVWIAALREQGYRVEVCYTWIEAREAILNYLGLPSQIKPWGTLCTSI